MEEEDSGLAERLGAGAETLPQELQGWFVGLGLDAACRVGRLRHQQQHSALSWEQPGTTVEAPSTQAERHTRVLGPCVIQAVAPSLGDPGRRRAR